ncbi:hypothetical protein VMCG_00861 [Cytospora schulzeri]|uniref:Sulfatase N-terminal domain-containing protein n=1 Tax=Cytospora schulzeri TaxID=448051 RepID=A0A423X653_9PEZI|nr:hypothetical protein VMCG_00861 [Valsa malicola]
MARLTGRLLRPLCYTLALYIIWFGLSHKNEATRAPNILFILTDDQDIHMDSLSYMPFLKEQISDEGTLFHSHYCTVALCCPSRVNMWTGKAAHNTNVTDLRPPYGEYPRFVEQGFNDNYLPIWLQAAGYNTYYVGKLFNAHIRFPRGGLARFQRNRETPRSYEGQYSTDVIAEKSNVQDGAQSPPRPAERHKHLFPEAKVPRTPSFNSDARGGVSWVSRLPKQSEDNVEYNDEWYRNRLRTLQAVDEMIDNLVKMLTYAGALDNTYIFFSTDNGYSIGQHRRQPGKQCAFEEDINVPLVVRGLGVPEGHVSDAVTSHTDIAPTILQIAGVSVEPQAKYEFDGAPIPLHTPLAAPERKQEHFNVEMWGIILSEGKYGFDLYRNHIQGSQGYW